MQKRGLSDVVSTVLIILLVVAAVAIIGAIVLNSVNKVSTTLSVTSSCSDISIAPTSCQYDSSGYAVVYTAKYPNTVVLNNLTLVTNRVSGGSISSDLGTSIINGETKKFTGTNTPTNNVTMVSLTYNVKLNGNSFSCPSSISVACVPSNTAVVPVPPAVPTINSVLTSIGSVNLAWSAVSGALSYNIYSCSGNAFDNTYCPFSSASLIGSTSSTSYSFVPSNSLYGKKNFLYITASNGAESAPVTPSVSGSPISYIYQPSGSGYVYPSGWSGNYATCYSGYSSCSTSYGSGSSGYGSGGNFYFIVFN